MNSGADPNWQEDAFLRRIGIARFQRIVFLLHRLRRLLRFFRLRAPLRQLTQGGDDLFYRRGLHPEDMNTQRLQLVNLAFGIAPAPGQHHVWL